MFYIIEQGARIITPVDRLLRQDGVAAISATPPVAAIKAEAPTDAGQYSAKHPMPTPYDELAKQQSRSRVVYAHQIMTSPVVTASMDQKLSVIWSLFAKQIFHHLPLLDDDKKLQGIVSDRDLLRFAANHQRELGDHPISRLMSRQVISVAPETEVRVIAEVMCKRSIGAVPVVDDNVVVVGIVTRSDILRTLVHQAPLELWA